MWSSPRGLPVGPAPRFWPGASRFGLEHVQGLGADVDPSRVIIGHCDKVNLLDYHLELARRGAYVQFDTLHECVRPGETGRRVAFVMKLVHVNPQRALAV